MTDKEKLTLILRESLYHHEYLKEKWILEGKVGCKPDLFSSFADNLLQNGVTFAKDTNVLTNADRIRAMTDEELAEFLNSTEVCDNQPLIKCRTASNGKCIACTLDWLKQPVEVKR